MLSCCLHALTRFQFTHASLFACTSLYYLLALDTMILMEDTEPIIVTPTPQYQAWLQAWDKHMEGASSSVLVPASARSIQTPLILSNWSQALQTHPNQILPGRNFTWLLYWIQPLYNISQKCTQEPRRCATSCRCSG